MGAIISIIVPPIEGDYNILVEEIMKQTYRPLEIVLCINSQPIPLKQVNQEDLFIQYLSILKEDTHWEYMKKALEKSKGEFVVLYEPKDISDRKRLQKQIEFLGLYNNSQCVGCLIEETKVIEDMVDYKGDIENRYNLYKNPQRVDYAIQYDHIGVYLPTLLLRKEMIRCILQDMTLSEVTEEAIILEILSTYEIHKIDKVLYRYRWARDRRLPIDQKIDEDIKVGIKYRGYIRDALQEVDDTKIDIPTHKVIMIVDRLDIGGTETYIMNLTKELRKSNIEVSVLSGGGCMEKIFRARGIKCYRIEWEAEHIESECIDLLKNDINCILSHSDRGHRLAKKIYDKLRIPYIPVLHGLFHTRETLQEVSPKAWKIICVSYPVYSYLREHIEPKYFSKGEVIYNSIDDYSEVTEVPMNRQITYCSRLDYTKGRRCGEIMDVFKQMVEEGERAYLTVLGDGRLKSYLDEKATFINQVLKYPAIKMLGMQYHTKHYYEKSQLVIGTGRVALEALQCARPVIAMGSKGLGGIVSRETKKEMEATYFSDHGEHTLNEQNLGNYLGAILKDREACRDIGLWGKKWCSEIYSNEVQISKIVDIIKGASYR